MPTKVGLHPAPDCILLERIHQDTMGEAHPKLEEIRKKHRLTCFGKNNFGWYMVVNTTHTDPITYEAGDVVIVETSKGDYQALEESEAGQRLYLLARLTDIVGYAGEAKRNGMRVKDPYSTSISPT